VITSTLVSNCFIYHDELDGSADEAVLDGAREEEGCRVFQQLTHDVVLPVAQAGQVTQGEKLGGDLGSH
jgi:hypothetical protein